MKSDPNVRLWPILWQGALLAPLLLLIALIAALLWHRSAWDRQPRWQEAWRHAHRPWIAMERWVHFRWIHPGAQYWVLPVHLDRGPIRLQGQPPDASYWSLTWYAGTEVHATLDSHTVELEAEGTYRIQIGEAADGPNSIPAAPGAGRAILYLRVYEPRRGWPVQVPDVWQDGELLTQGGTP